MKQTAEQQTAEQQHRSSWRGTIETVRQVSVLATPVLLIFVAWFQYESRALVSELEAQSIEQWESPAFQRRVDEIISARMITENLATKSDVARLESRVQDLSDQLRPITAHLIRSGLIE